MLPEFLLPVLVFIPLVFIPLLWLSGQSKAHVHKYIAGFAVLVQVVLALFVYVGFSSGLQQTITFSQPWFSISILKGHIFQSSLAFSLDGLNAVFVLLSAIVMFLGWVASFNQTKRTSAYFSLYLLLASTVFGSFLAADFVLFYVFFEFMLLPMFFLIGIWGGYRREYASLKFFIYTLVGSLFILMSGLALNISTATVVHQGTMVHSFLYQVLQNPDNLLANSPLHPTNTQAFLSIPVRHWAFILMLVGFLIKLPAIPFHTWLPDAHVEASNAISVVLAGILLKIGGYGLIRLAFGFFPDVAISYGWFVGLTGVAGIVYGALNALAMSDLKKLVAYSSVSHMGFVLVGLAAFNVEGVNGAVFQMFSHGLSSSLLFLLVAILYDRTFDRQINHYRGLAGRMPFFTAFVVVGFFASMGMPGFSSFISEFLVVSASLKSALLTSGQFSLDLWMPMGAILGIALNATYFLWAFRRMFFGLFWCKGGTQTESKLTDITAREWLVLLVPAILLILFGLMPQLVIDVIEPYANGFINLF